MNNNLVVGGVIVVIIIVAVGLVMYNRPAPTSEITATPDLGTAPDVNSDATSLSAGSESDVPDMSTTPEASPDASASPAISPATSGAVKDFTVTGSNYSFSPSQITVKQGDTVRITFKNTSGSMHSWNLDAFNVATKVIAAGQQETVQFVASKTGQFEYYCSVGSHRQMGMKGTLIVQ